MSFKFKFAKLDFALVSLVESGCTNKFIPRIERLNLAEAKTELSGMKSKISTLAPR